MSSLSTPNEIVTPTQEPRRRRRFIVIGSTLIVLIVVFVIVILPRLHSTNQQSQLPHLFTTLYTADGSALNLAALNSDDGSIKWTSPENIYNGEILSFQKNAIYFSDNKANLFALNALTGATLWHWPYTGTIYGGDATHIYVNTAGDASGNTNADNQVTALNLANGVADWHITIHQADRFIVGKNTPYVLDNIKNGEQYLEQIDPDIGTVMWKTSATVGFVGIVEGPINNVLYAFGEDTFNAIDARTGAILWQMPSGQREVFSCGQQTVCLGYANGAITAVNATTGNKLWHYDFSHPTDPNEFIYGFSFGVDENVIVIHASKNIAVIHKNDGSLVWEKTLMGSNATSPNPYPIGNGIIYVNEITSNRQPLEYLNPVTTTAFDVTTGRTLWQAANNDMRPGTPILLGNVVVTSNSSNITAFDAKTGKVHWNKQFKLSKGTGRIGYVVGY